jgi:uncharacterized protein (TIGR00369 family)
VSDTADNAATMQDQIARFIESVHNGENLLGMLPTTVVDVDGADLVLDLDIHDRITGPRGALQGGAIATLADLVGGRMAMQGAGPDSIVVTTDLTVHFLAPVMSDTARAVGTVLRRGKRAVTVRVDIYDGVGGPLASACTLAFKVITPTR